MVTKELLDFLTAQHSFGMSREEMERLLVSEGGWEKADVEEALTELGITATPLVPAPVVLAQALAEKVLHVTHANKVEPLPHEDFLGILQPSISQSYPQEEPQQEKQQEEQSVQQPEQKQLALDELLAPVTMREEPAPAAAPFQVEVAQPALVEEKPVFTFNLAAIRDTAAPPVVEAPVALAPEIKPEPAPPSPAPVVSPLEKVFPKTIETKSGSAMWLSGMGQNQDGSQSTTEAQKMTEEAKYPPRSSVRSMSQDILLRGRGSSVPGMPAMVAPMTEDEKLMTETLAQKEKIQKEKEAKEAKEAKAAALLGAKEKAKAAEGSPEEAAKKHRIKKILGIAVGVILFLALAGGAFASYVFLAGPDVGTLLSGALTQLTGSQSFAYSGTASSSITLSAASDGVVRNGNVAFGLAISGQLKNGAEGFGDGNHHTHFIGGLHSGDYNWSTDIESDFRMIANILYFHVSSFPAQSDLDPEIFKTYWIKIDVPEIVKELALSSGNATPDNYGNLAGGGDRESNFNALLTKNLPWKGGTKVGKEKVGGVDTVRIKLAVDKDAMYDLVTKLYQKYTGKSLTLDADGELRLKNALKKTVVEVWVDPTRKTLAKFSLYGDYDDDIAGIHAKGPLSMTIEFSQYNASVGITLPQPIITLDDLKVRMDDYKKLSGVRANDAAKVNALGEIGSVLKEYYAQKGVYPSFLTDLRKSGAISSSTISDALYKQVVYAAYMTEGNYTKANKCTPKSKTCAVYHIGINFEDPTDPSLTSDADVTSDVRGADNAGCAGELTASCYDILVGAVATTTPPVAGN